jgi:folate-binding protein YgfZ
VTSPFAVRLDRDVVRVSGPDAVKFLQGQVSQDVAGLAIGASAWSFVLAPQGKVDAWFRVTREADDSVLLDVDAGWGPALVARVNRFKLRVKADVEPLAWQCISIRYVPADASVYSVPDGLALAVEWFGATGVDLLGPSVEPPSDIPVGTALDYDLWRVATAFPAMGHELDDTTIPAESGVVDVSVSFTKGCYTGQELVARVDSRGNNTPRRLRRVELEQSAPAGTELSIDGAVVGVLTSVAGTHALAYVKRSVEPPATATLTDAGSARITVLERPTE